VSAAAALGPASKQTPIIGIKRPSQDPELDPQSLLESSLYPGQKARR
jgi:hypothetical protein